MEDRPISIQPADRLSLVQEYYFSRKLKEVARLNAEGRDIISLAIGSPDMPPSEKTITTLCEVARRPDTHGYQPTMGTPELRGAMADFYQRWYGVTLDPAKEVLPLIGSKEGILHVTLAFVNPGDGVLVPNPGYPTYTSLSKILGARIVNYNLREDNGWQPDFDELEAMDLSGVKLMWTNYPNMPTGGDARMETYERLVDFARRHGIVVVNDNPYSFILNHHPKSLLQVPGAKECCIEFNSMSKSHNMPGWRVGLCATNATFISWILKVKSNIDSGTFRGIQLAAAQAYGLCQCRRMAPAGQYRDLWPQARHCRKHHDPLGLHLRPQSGGNVSLGKDTREIRRCGTTHRARAPRGKGVHHPGLHLREQRQPLYPHLALCQGRQDERSTQEDRDYRVVKV